MKTPFNQDDTATYLRWREHKLANAITDTNDLIVEIKDPRALTSIEHAALLERCRHSNMAIYATQVDMDEVKVQKLGAQFGLKHLDANWLAGEDGISEIRVVDNGTRKHYIPYTDRPIKWHTDGYYNTPERTIRAMLLHCVMSASSGGENQLMDHEIAYLLLRDQDPQYIHALSAKDALTIPERVDEADGVRPAQSGPVFSFDVAGNLHMRYTARTRSIEWKQDATTLAAVAALEKLLASDLPHILKARLEPGMGLLCNNVLHDRAGFVDDVTAPRVLYRARYHERISGTSLVI